ncbi:hypothetical protein SDJN02_24352, partial [Cucurbita argyrosperma subsp. argyrosperma]
MPSAFFFFFFLQSTNLQAHRQNPITFPPENPTFPTCSDSYSKELDFGYELDFSLPISIFIEKLSAVGAIGAVGYRFL